METLFLFFVITTVNAVFNCDNTGPVYGADYRKTRICPGCAYSTHYSPGYDYIDISHSFKQNVTQIVYQNNQPVGICNQLQYCNLRVLLNNNYDYTINFTQTSNSVTSCAEPIAPPKAAPGHLTVPWTTRNSPPVLNAENEEQIGVVCNNCVYYYVITTSNPVILDAEFTARLNILIINNNKIIYNDTKASFYEVIHGEVTEYRLILYNQYPTTVSTVEFWFNSQGGYIDYQNYDAELAELRAEMNKLLTQKNNNRPVIIAVSVIAVCTVTINVIILFYTYRLIKFNRSYANQF